jgi:hypothetical protein
LLIIKKVHKNVLQVIQDKNPSSDEDRKTVAQIHTTKNNKKGNPDSKCSSGIGTASHQSSRMRDGPDDMSSRTCVHLNLHEKIHLVGEKKVKISV